MFGIQGTKIKQNQISRILQLQPRLAAEAVSPHGHTLIFFVMLASLGNSFSPSSLKEVLGGSVGETGAMVNLREGSSHLLSSSVLSMDEDL
ncbi:hypothetical protein HUJ04_004091 [Dendroctonus ponderosae]|nr:hypothetical protein HUJ04_004091 [Dendroctonus ponderosae]